MIASAEIQKRACQMRIVLTDCSILAVSKWVLVIFDRAVNFDCLRAHLAAV